METLELVQYVIMFNLALLFTILGLKAKEQKIVLKMIAGFCWAIFAVLQYLLGEGAVLSNVCGLLFSVFAVIVFASLIYDYGHKEGYQKQRTMGVFD